MRVKSKKLVITFPTTTKAIAMEKECRINKKPGRLIPVPRELSAGCGMAWCAQLTDREELELFLEERALVFEEIYEILL